MTQSAISCTNSIAFGVIFFSSAFASFTFSMTSFLIELISNYGYLGMFIGMILEAIIIVIPSEFILATGGILAANKIFSFFGAFLIGLLGSVFCAIIIYAMGYFGGRAFIEKYGKYFFMKKEDIDKADNWFNKYGLFAAFIGRNFPIIRTFISLPLGITRVNFIKFIIYTTLGSIPWTFIFIYVGYMLGSNWTILNDYTSKLKIPIIILITLLIINYLYKRFTKSKKNG